MFSNKKEKIIFFGNDNFALPSFECLLKEKYTIQYLITLPDSIGAIKQGISISPLLSSAQKYQIPIIKPSNLNDPEFLNSIKKIEPDIGIIINYGKILPKSLIDIPKKGFINIHPSLLPKYRGPSPIQTAIRNGDTQIGLTIIKIDEKMDHGPILIQKKIDIKNHEKYINIYNNLALESAHLLLRLLPEYFAGLTELHIQNDAEATFTKMITTEDGRITKDYAVEKAFNTVRALQNNPGVFIILDNLRLSIIDATPGPIKISVEAGSLLVIEKKLYLQLKDGLLELLSIKPAGRKTMNAQEFINGYQKYIIHI